jgi:hypothetical protein
MNPVHDMEGAMVPGFAESQCGLDVRPLGDYERLDSALDYESTGRRVTAAKALHLMTRGAHVSGFVLRPDDGLSDVAIVCNGVTRFLPPGEMQWLMHESGSGSILSDDDRLRVAAGEVLKRLEELPWGALELMSRADFELLIIELRHALEGVE